MVTGLLVTLLLVASPAHALAGPQYGLQAPAEEVAPDQAAEGAASPSESAAALAPPPPTPCLIGWTVRWACVDLTSGQAWLMNGEQVHYGPVKIRSGSGEIEPRTGQPKITPVGRHRVQWKHMQHESGEYPNPQHPERGAYMPFAVFFADGGIAIHGAGSLDNPSAGCVKMQMPYTPTGEPDYAAESSPRAFYEYLKVEPEGGDEVQVVQT